MDFLKEIRVLKEILASSRQPRQKKNRCLRRQAALEMSGAA
jgi:hypothetical protein